MAKYVEIIMCICAYETVLLFLFNCFIKKSVWINDVISKFTNQIIICLPSLRCLRENGVSALYVSLCYTDIGYYLKCLNGITVVVLSKLLLLIFA